MKGGERLRILLIDDDAALGELLAEYFAGFGHRLSTATSATKGRYLLRRDAPDLLILDVMLPDADGMELCREVRDGSDIPIIMLTARGDLPDRVLGLELGADDYVPKPFEPRELVARVETLLRRARHLGAGKLVAGDLTLDPDSRSVTLAGCAVELTTAEFELLQALMAKRGRIFSRDQLLHRLHGFESEAYDRSIDMLVSRLRAKLGEDPRAPRFIKTVRGAGYQFIATSDA